MEHALCINEVKQENRLSLIVYRNDAVMYGVII